MSCPTDCHENIQRLFSLSWPAWTRAVLVSLIGVLFGSVAFVYMNGTAVYATKEDLKESRAELKTELRDLNAKLDILLQRGK